MNKNVKALRNIEDKKNSIIINGIFMIFLITPNIANLYLSSKAINKIDFNVSVYFTNQFLYYIKNIVANFIVVNLSCFNEIKEYHSFYYLPISVDEFYQFFIQKYKNKFTIITVTNLLTFIVTIINLKLSKFILISDILFLVTITFLAYYLVNILLSYLLLNIPLKAYKKIITISLSLSVFINIIPSTNLKVISNYLEEYIFTEYFSLRILLIEILLVLFILILKKIKFKLLKKVFEKSVKAEEQSRKYNKYININKLKVKTPLSAYINNEVLLLRKGYFKLLNGLVMTVTLYFIMLLAMIVILSSFKLSDRVITFTIIYIISLFVDLVIANYSINSISFMDDFIEWIKGTSLNELTYYRAKLLVKCVLNLIIFVIMIAGLYIILPLVKISNDNIIIQAILCYFNIFIMTYFDNNLDFRYQIFSRDTNRKVCILIIKKYSTVLIGKIVVAAIQLLIYIYLLRNIYISIIFSYLLLSIIIYSFKESIVIQIPIKRAKREEKYISIDELI